MFPSTVTYTLVRKALTPYHGLSSLQVTYFQICRWDMVAEQAKTWWQGWVQEDRAAVQVTFGNTKTF